MPKIVNHNEYRQELLEKSFQLFTHKGYTNVSMKEIAEEIGVSTGTLYHYFPSKEKILAEMISSIGLQNTEEYINRTSSVESIRDRFDMIVDFWKEKGELYEKILLLGFDMYRNTDIEQWKPIYAVFAERYTAGMSERLNISRRFARSIFIYFLGLSFHGLATDSMDEYNKEIDFLDVIFRPLIVDANEDTDKAAQKFKGVYQSFLAKSSATENGTVNLKKNTEAQKTPVKKKSSLDAKLRRKDKTSKNNNRERRNHE